MKNRKQKRKIVIVSNKRKKNLLKKLKTLLLDAPPRYFPKSTNEATQNPT